MKGYVERGKELAVSLLLPASLFFLYILFPVKSSSIDAFASAYQINEQIELFSPHHLLYNITGRLWVLLLSAAGFTDVMAALKIMNALAAIIALAILNSIMKIRGVRSYERTAWIMLAGFTWGVMRFATENETYLLPIVFSLAGSYYIARYLVSGVDKDLVLSGFFSAFAVLMHQIHFFWWVAILTGLFVKRIPRMKVLLFFLPSVIVPITYWLVLIFDKETTISVGTYLGFIFSDFKEESVRLTVSLNGLILTPISFFRTFFQVHGYVWNMIRDNLLYLIPALLSGALVLYSVVIVSKKRSIARNYRTDWFIKTHLLALGYHLLIAFLSSGNAEFMVMFPFLIVMIVSSLTDIRRRILIAMSIALMIWNISFGLIPLHTESLRDDELITVKITESAEKGHDVFVILEDKPIIENRLRYYSGINADNILSIKDVEKEGFTGLIDSLLTTGTVVLTNCIDRPATLSRASFFPHAGSGFFDGYSLLRIDSANSLSGRYYIHRIYAR